MDTPAEKILNIKTTKDDYLLLICHTPFKVKIDYIKEPIVIEASKFIYNNIEYIYNDSENYYFGTKQGEVMIFNNQMNLVTKFQDPTSKIINVIAKWNDKLVIIGDDNIIKVLNSRVHTLFIIRINHYT